MKRYISIILVIAMIIVSVLSLSSCGKNESDSSVHHIAMKVKNFGTITFELYADQAPITVEHILKLAKTGKFDNTYFIRYQEGFVLQGGAGSTSTETIKGEFIENGVNNTIKHEKGVISMARATDPNSASTQFFIVTDTNDSVSSSLDGKYAAFGKITKGWDVFEKILKYFTPAMYPYTYEGVLMGFVSEEYYITIETITVID